MNPTKIITIDLGHKNPKCHKCECYLQVGEQVYRKSYGKSTSKTKYYHQDCFARMYQ